MVKIILGNIWSKSEGKQEKTAPFTIEDKVKHSAVKWQLIVWNCQEYKGKVIFLWEIQLGVGTNCCFLEMLKHLTNHIDYSGYNLDN